MATNNKQVKDLLHIAASDEWKDFIFDLQTVLIGNGYVETLTEIGRSDFAVKTQALYNFFGELGKKKP